MSMMVCACGSPKNEDKGFEPLPQSNNPNVPQYEVPEVANGYFLQSRVVSFGNDPTFREIEYTLDETTQSLSEYDVNSNGEKTLALVLNYNEDGLITQLQDIAPTGTVLQTFQTRYDSRKRLVSEATMVRELPIFSTQYRFNDVGAPFKKVVSLTADETEFSETTFQYDNDRRLVSSIFRSELLPQEVRRNYTFSTDGLRLEAIEGDDGARIVFEYDEFGNRIAETTYNEVGEVTFTSVLTYVQVEGKVPNLPLHRAAYEPDLLF